MNYNKTKSSKWAIFCNTIGTQLDVPQTPGERNNLIFIKSVLISRLSN